jgi:ribosomal-protein-alanine N-acetyltransferase
VRRAAQVATGAESETAVKIVALGAGAGAPPLGMVAAVDELARATFAEEAFSLIAELERPWTRVWVAEAPTPGPRGAAGFAIAWHVADELHVLNVATDESVRRRGVATAIMSEALHYARVQHVRIVLLEVRRSNRPALRLYRKLGFTAMGVRPGYYGDNGEDAIEMVLALDPQTGAVLPGKDEIRIEP